ncbi:hemerythrin domain-containing protein [Streptomyces sp. NPDC050804]|uniref:hemerythrin domain-containing protein n=1 Tax=Streptomyces sp. NPDC050804 TaxID=3154745 RepID=UPI003439D4D3
MTSTNGPYADTRDMYMAHTMFRREFSLMPGLVRDVAVGDAERVQIVSGHIEFVETILHHHHDAEDKHLWPKLQAREPVSAAGIVRVMEEQHAEIDRIGTEIADAMAAWRRNADADSRGTLADALGRMNLLIVEHTALEEERILPLVEKCVTAAEWDLMIREGGEETPPEILPLILGMMMYEGDPELIRDIVAGLPPKQGPAIEDIASQAFASHSKRIHGTSTPPRSTGF